MQAIIDIYRMKEVDAKTRAKIIIKLGSAINGQYAMNLTEGLVYELVKNLDKDNPILQNEHYSKFNE